MGFPNSGLHMPRVESALESRLKDQRIFNRPFETSRSICHRLDRGRKGGASSWVAVRPMLSESRETYDLGNPKGFFRRWW